MNHQLLPRVKEGVIDSLTATINHDNSHQYYINLQKRMLVANPELFKMINDIAEALKEREGEETHNIAWKMALLVYRALESQAEADEMEKIV